MNSFDVFVIKGVTVQTVERGHYKDTWYTKQSVLKLSNSKAGDL